MSIITKHDNYNDTNYKTTIQWEMLSLDWLDWKWQL